MEEVHCRSPNGLERLFHFVRAGRHRHVGPRGPFDIGISYNHRATCCRHGTRCGHECLNGFSYFWFCASRPYLLTGESGSGHAVRVLVECSIGCPAVTRLPDEGTDQLGLLSQIDPDRACDGAYMVDPETRHTEIKCQIGRASCRERGEVTVG